MPEPTPSTVGQRLDQCLAPFLEQQQAVLARLQQQTQELAELTRAIESTRAEAHAVETQMAEAARELARQDSVLAALLGVERVISAIPVVPEPVDEPDADVTIESPPVTEVAPQTALAVDEALAAASGAVESDEAPETVGSDSAEDKPPAEAA